LLSFDRRRRIVNGIYIGLASACFLVALIPLVSIIYFTGSQGISSLNLEFFTRVTGDYNPLTGLGGGILNALQGTFLMVGLASSFGVPLGIFAGAYMAEYPGTLSSITRLLADALTGVPSIVTGIFVSGLIVITTHHFSAAAGGFALGTMMVPIVAVSTQEALRLVPSEIREGGLALGLSKSRVLLQVLLSTAKKGVATGIILALARVMGETAPLLLTDLGFNYLASGLNSQAGSLTLVVWSFALSGDPAAIRFAWGTALVLVLLVLGLNVIVRIVSRQRLAANQ
jgi:phosphate transport system permease protein